MTIHQLRELRERVQEDLLTHFDGTTLGTQSQHQKQMRSMCEIIVSNFNRYEGQTEQY